ncbi:MAG TPA: CUAEP/CCAEP-tail radical SAM protein, partial [Kofleriaceae bacterium]|nr:CUAEP/CCAEP-tail radical SAM protein [Kofleriaceae bacterium]
MKIALLSCYELGHQPAGLAVPLAFLERAGYRPIVQDLSVEQLDDELVRDADFIGIAVPMHTALRLGVRAAARIRELNPRARVCFFGLYAPLNEAYLRESGVDFVLGGECEDALVELVDRLARRERSPRPAPVTLAKLAFPTPSRAALPPLRRYARLVAGGGERLAGYTETSRGCLHMCRHCPIPPVYGGRFFVIDRDTVLADIAAQIAAGAEHITFGTPDFFNGPRHGMEIVRELHRRWPAVTFDVTIKVSHLLARRGDLAELAALGCAFVVTAVESLDDGVLARLDKGHTRADFELALALARAAGLVLRPTFLPFTPWTTLEQIAELVDFIEREDLIDCVDPVQLSIRLLVPPGSLLLGPETRDAFGELDPVALSHTWTHADPRVDRLQQDIARIVEE